MASLREIRRKIKSIKSTQQITKAMKMVATARLRKAQQAILSARPYAQKMEELISGVHEHTLDIDSLPFTVKPTGTMRLLLIVTSDKGLCGGFNASLVRETLRYLRRYGADRVRLLVVGRKGRDAFRRMPVTVLRDYVGILGHVTFAQAELMTTELLDAFRSGEYVGVDMLYNEFRSAVHQQLVLKPLLPVVPPEKRRLAHWPEYEFEPAKEELLRALWLRHLKAQVYRVLLESAASELGARMSAMDNATRNASELLESLTLSLNRTRQASITKEILEVVSGAEALR